MVQEDMYTVKKMIIDFSKREGSTIPVEEIVRLAGYEGISSDAVTKVIESMILDGMLVQLDEDTIEIV